MSDENEQNERVATMILAGSAVVSIVIGFSSGSIGTAIGSFMMMVMLFAAIGDSLRK